MTTTPIVALDVASADAAMRVVESLGERCRFYKIGSELFTAAGPGIVCSGAEAANLRSRFGERLAILVPGIRMAGSAANDQRRVVTPAGAAAAGARYIVVGRAVTAAPDPRAAMDQVLGELTSVAV